MEIKTHEIRDMYGFGFRHVQQKHPFGCSQLALYAATGVSPLLDDLTETSQLASDKILADAGFVEHCYWNNYGLSSSPWHIWQAIADDAPERFVVSITIHSKRHADIFHCAAVMLKPRPDLFAIVSDPAEPDFLELDAPDFRLHGYAAAYNISHYAPTFIGIEREAVYNLDAPHLAGFDWGAYFGGSYPADYRGPK